MVVKRMQVKLDLRHAKRDGNFPIVIEIWNIDKVRVNTLLSARPENWEDGEYNKKESNYARKNVMLKEACGKAERVLLEIAERGERLSDKKLREALVEAMRGKEASNKAQSAKYFIDYLDEFVSQKSNAGTRQVYSTTRNKLAEFDPKCTFENMDKKWLARFERWMIDNGMKINAYAIHLRNIRAVFNYCIDEEYTTLYPFRKFKIKKEETRKRSLTIDQLITLRDYPCEEYQVRYRDIFMLMFYFIGINAADLFNATSANIVDGRLEYKRAKTGKLYSIKIEPEAMAILERYKGEKHLLNAIDEYTNYKDFLHRMGNGLKRIGECERKGLGGKKIISPLFPEISSYWARHTWATIAASLDIPKETISAALGHEIGSKVTSIYINFDTKKVDEANRKIISYLETFQINK